MLDPKSWEHHTKAVTSGRGVRVEHDCGEGRVLKVSNGEHGYNAWCFRCGEGGFLPHPAPSLSERLAQVARSRLVEAKVAATVALPQPAITDPQLWPVAARLWLYKAGFSNDDIINLGFYWCEPIARVVLPVTDPTTGAACYWQARAVTADHQPKYINPIIDKSSLAAKYSVGLGDTVVLTEDILSAYRVGRVTEAWSILGTSLADGVAGSLATIGKPVIVMLDPDPAGQRGGRKAVRRLRSLGVPAYMAHPKRDPKFLTKQETLECINDSINS